MPLHPKLEKKLNGKFEAGARIDDKHLNHDITFVTNEFGEPVTLFIGKRRPDGAIQGERYVRSITRKPNSTEILKSHWDLKGKVTRT